MNAPRDIDLPGVEVDDLLVWRVQVDLERNLLAAVQGYMAEKVDQGVRGVVLDLSSLQVIDGEMVRTIRDLVGAVRLVGGSACICGVRPGVALCLVHLGEDFGDVPTARDLRQARRLLSVFRS